MICGLVFEKLWCYAIGYPIKVVCVINRDDRRKLLAAVGIASDKEVKAGSIQSLKTLLLPDPFRYGM